MGIIAITIVRVYATLQNTGTDTGGGWGGTHHECLHGYLPVMNL